MQRSRDATVRGARLAPYRFGTDEGKMRLGKLVTGVGRILVRLKDAESEEKSSLCSLNVHLQLFRAIVGIGFSLPSHVLGVCHLPSFSSSRQRAVRNSIGTIMDCCQNGGHGEVVKRILL